MSTEDLFKQFWKAYPLKKSKKQARTTFHKLQITEALLQEILTAVHWQTKEWQARNFEGTPYPSTYLNDERWEDMPTPSTDTSAFASSPAWIRDIKTGRAS
jgi:hypothetical protein